MRKKLVPCEGIKETDYEIVVEIVEELKCSFRRSRMRLLLRELTHENQPTLHSVIPRLELQKQDINTVNAALSFRKMSIRLTFDIHGDNRWKEAKIFFAKCAA